MSNQFNLLICLINANPILSEMGYGNDVDDDADDGGATALAV